MNRKPPTLSSALALAAILLAPATHGAPSEEAVRELLSAQYYEVEFFVFERPAVMEFNTVERLALDAPRRLPAGMRTLRLDPEALWTDPLAPWTRACLTFPTLSYRLLPDPDAPAAHGDTPAGGELPRGEGPAGEPSPGPAGARRAPDISPRLEPHPLLDFLAGVAAFERSLAATSQRWQPAEAFTLSREAGRVQARGVGRVLFHGRWLDAVPPRDAPQPVLIRGGEVLHLPGRVHELVGTVSVTLGRYLHFQTELYFHAPGLGLVPAAAVAGPDGEPTLRAPEIPAARYMRLSQSRRMRSGEVHYLDHPKLGVVVRIDPVPLPAELLDAFERLEESQE